MKEVLYRAHHHLSVFWLWITFRFRKTYVANVCGHTTKRKGCIKSLSKPYVMKMPLGKNGNPDYCLDCIAGMSIQCVRCEGEITVGDRVALYLMNEDYVLPLATMRFHVHGNSQYAVGCLRWNCVEPGGDCMHIWLPPGEVEYINAQLIRMCVSGEVVSKPNDACATNQSPA